MSDDEKKLRDENAYLRCLILHGDLETLQKRLARHSEYDSFYLRKLENMFEAVGADLIEAARSAKSKAKDPVTDDDSDLLDWDPMPPDYVGGRADGRCRHWDGKAFMTRREAWALHHGWPELASKK